MIRLLTYTISLLLINSCSSQTEKSAFEYTNLETYTNNEIANSMLLDLDSLLTQKNNSLLLSLDGDSLSFCCFPVNEFIKDIFLERLNFKKEKFNNEGEIEEYSVYYSDNSVIKLTEIEGSSVVVYGRIREKDLLKNDSIKLSMSKDDFLSLYFFKTPTFSKINEISISEDETDEYRITFLFEEEKLKEIRFGSFNDWIDQEW